MDLEVNLDGNGRVWLKAYEKGWAVEFKMGHGAHTEVSLSPNAKTINNFADKLEAFLRDPITSRQHVLARATIHVRLTPKVTNQSMNTLFVVRPLSTAEFPCESTHIRNLVAALRQVARYAAKYPL